LATIPAPVLSAESALRRETFFKVVFDNVKTTESYICIARRIARKGAFEERFFLWPSELDYASHYVTESVMTHDVWFCPMTFDKPERKKECVDFCSAVWSDLDTCPPDKLLVPPSVLLESSAGRYQALWILPEPIAAVDAETASKRVAYFHASDGADKSGWDLTQLLRVPETLNFKYNPPSGIHILGAGDNVSFDSFAIYPVVREDEDAIWPFPDEIKESAALLDKYKNDLDTGVWKLIQLEPEIDWSKSLWNLEMLLCESDLSREDIFSIVRDAKCNKYRRDGRSDQMLWKEVCKAWAKVKERNELIPDTSVFRNPDLLSDADLAAVGNDRTFIEDYIDWAKGVGDAAEAYHQAGAFVSLSGLLAGGVQLPTSYGMLIPNLWFLLLADTTLTRKSTALDLAVDLLIEIEPDVIMATDGSIEGLFSALSMRPGQPSIFLRDEFSGLVEMMTKRDYYAGMAETLTKMYDGKFQKRQLRREVIEVRDPVLILFAGGIKTKILQLLSYEHVTSGFLPRFIFITAKSNLSKLKPLGPPSQKTSYGRDEISKKLRRLKRHYQGLTEIKAGKVSIPVKKVAQAELTPSAWSLYNEMELRLLESGVKSIVQDMLTPTMDRLAKSGLKAAILIAASRMQERVIVDERDIMHAFAYVANWREFAIEVMSNIGTSRQERDIQLIYEAIRRNPGVQRSTLMRNYHLTKRDADITFDTLEQRGLIHRVRAGATERLTAVI
jgi:RepB DNA-primase from phage plasmid